MIGYDSLSRLAELVRRYTGSDEIVPPGLLLENDRPDWLFLKREKLWATGDTSVAAAVGNLGRVQIINPAGSKTLVTVLGAACVNKIAAGRVRLSIDAPLIAAGQTSNPLLDTRWPVPVSGVGTVLRLAVDNTLPAIAGIVIDGWTVPAAETRYSQLRPAVAILSPGHRLDLFDLTANEIFTAQFWGTERPVRPEELSD